MIGLGGSLARIEDLFFEIRLLNITIVELIRGSSEVKLPINGLIDGKSQRGKSEDKVREEKKAKRRSKKRSQKKSDVNREVRKRKMQVREKAGKP